MKIRIEETELIFVVINPDSPDEIQRNVFKRLNTGGMPLIEQEIRHALYCGPATDLLKKLVDSKEFVSATDNSVKDSRMAGQELVLRYLYKHFNEEVASDDSSARRSIGRDSTKVMAVKTRHDLIQGIAEEVIRSVER
jgi:hypothetical protein